LRKEVITMDGLGTRRWWALGALMLAVLAVGLDGTVLSVALPTDLPAGIYQVSVGMYRLKTGERLKDSSGKNEFVIGSFRH